MDTILNSATFASPLTRFGRLSAIASCAMSAISVLSGIDLRAIAWGGLWLRDIVTLKHANYIP